MTICSNKNSSKLVFRIFRFNKWTLDASMEMPKSISIRNKADITGLIKWCSLWWRKNMHSYYKDRRISQLLPIITNNRSLQYDNWSRSLSSAINWRRIKGFYDLDNEYKCRGQALLVAYVMVSPLSTTEKLLRVRNERISPATWLGALLACASRINVFCTICSNMKKRGTNPSHAYYCNRNKKKWNLTSKEREVQQHIS